MRLLRSAFFCNQAQYRPTMPRFSIFFCAAAALIAVYLWWWHLCGGETEDWGGPAVERQAQ
ncbi:Hypothetical protein MexAM1_META1p4066 [Methylorubrum extorquens AM1]|uniref:Uncharacterized protein n=1 Tax=Methylorubrum extorquens (strain ATCC 14718 / DSM 1338 / JCM 2805 / NCIMB 9133 / AM1) TaxID=272630 RepID=C5B1C2_METEA|nr:Hypothetical protein MexAM1_META1p4066 [Methylorubrum extorquens AM1]